MASALPQRNLPAVNKVLAQVGDIDLPRPAIVAVIRRVLNALRAADEIPGTEEIFAQIRTALRQLQQQRVVPVINATGVLIHTNLGRAPLGQQVMDDLVQVASQYGNLEYDLTTGQRGGRSAYLEHNLALLCGAESATVVNNNVAPATLTTTNFVWTELSGSMYVDYFRFDGSNYYNGNDNSSPTNVSGSSAALSGGSSAEWRMDFDGEPFEPITGTYSLTLTFDFPGWGTCVISDSVSG